MSAVPTVAPDTGATTSFAFLAGTPKPTNEKAEPQPCPPAVPQSLLTVTPNPLNSLPQPLSYHCRWLLDERAAFCDQAFLAGVVLG